MDEILAPLQFSHLSISERADRAKDLLRDVVKAFRQSRPSDAALDVHKIMDKYRTVIRLVRILPRDKLDSMYSSLVIEGKSTNSRGLYTLFFNAMLISGTSPALYVCDKLVRANQVDPVQKTHYLLAVPRYVRFPTKQFIQMFKSTVEKEVTRDNIYGQVGILSLASLTYQACVNSRVAEAKFPVQVSGSFCGPNYAREQVLSYFEKLWDGVMHGGRSEQKAVVLSAVGILGLPEVIPRLERVIKDQSQSTFVRTKAVFAYKRLTQSSNGK